MYGPLIVKRVTENLYEELTATRCLKMLQKYKKASKKSVKLLWYAFPLKSAIKLVMILVNSLNNLLQL